MLPRFRKRTTRGIRVSLPYIRKQRDRGDPDVYIILKIVDITKENERKIDIFVKICYNIS